MSNSECNKDHRSDQKFDYLPHDQGGIGRHKCSGCAYDLGFHDGLQRHEQILIDLDNLPYSQAGYVRHISPHAAYAKGYYDGVVQSYQKKL